jgi:hypothetical protein
MSPLTMRLVRSAFVFLVLGIALGVCFGLSRGLGAVLRPLHAELNLWGFVTLLVYGMAYHMFPRFAGRPLARPRLAEAQSWLAIAGVILAALGWLAVTMTLPFALPLLVVAGALELVAALLFAGAMLPLIRVTTATA